MDKILDKRESNNMILLRRNKLQEINLNYKKIYDLNQLDNISNISQEEKLSILITIKKLLLTTNNYLDISNRLELIRYILLSFIIFLLFEFLYSPIYKINFLTEEEERALPKLSILKQFYYYILIEILEIAFRIAFNIYKKKRITKIMMCYGRNELSKNSFSFYFELNEKNFDLLIKRKSSLQFPYGGNKNLLSLFEKFNFFQYVINYPNVRYYKWDKKILNEKENEIVTTIVASIKELEKYHVKKYSFSVIIVWVLYFFGFKCLVVAQTTKFLFYRFSIFIFTKIFSIFMSKDFKNCLSEKQELLSKVYIRQNYFIILNASVIQIFKLNQKYVDNSYTIEESYKNIYKDAYDLYDTILRN